MSSCFADRLERHASLTPAEREALVRLEEHPRHYSRGTLIRRDHDPARELFILTSGWTLSQVLLDDGNRQILRVDLPGDLIGTCSIAYAQSLESIVALTDVTVCAFDKQMLRQIYAEFPRVAALIHILTSADRVALGDRLASIGRTSAKARVAALLVDLITRLRLSRDDLGNKVPLLLTQEEIGDATGLTAVHVNRTLRVLEKEGLIARTAGHVLLLDEPRLRQLACYSSRYANLDTSWLPTS